MSGGIFSEPLVRDFIAFARFRLAWALALVVAGAVLEGAGILLLVPIVGLALGGPGGEWVAAVAGPVLGDLSGVPLETRMAYLLGLFCLILALRFAVLMVRDRELARLEQDFVVALRGRAFRRLAAMPWSELAVLGHGRVGHALTRDIDRAASGVGSLVAGATAVLVMLAQLAIALALAPEITVMAMLAGLATYRALRWLRARARDRGEALTEDDFALFETTTQFLKGLKPTKAHGLEAEYVAAFENAASRTAMTQRLFLVDRTLGRLLMQSVAAVVAVLAVIVGLFWLHTPAELLIVAILILGRLYTPLLVVQHTVQGVRHAAAGYRTARRLIETGAPPAAAPEPPAAPAERLAAPPEIGFQSVTLQGDDPDGAPILDRVDCLLPAGAVTALTGPSGAGKSTLADLAVGLLGPDEGTVFVDGAPMVPALHHRLRASTAYVGQEPFLIEDSLRGNLCWGCGDCSEARIWAALETVGAAALARGLPGGLDGAIRSEGLRLSGGERQRLRLARALLRRPRFLVLDEATNALDPDAEAAVLSAVLAAVREDPDKATVLMISHRGSNLRLAGHVIRLEQGKLAGSGPLAAVPAGAAAATMRRPGEK